MKNRAISFVHAGSEKKPGACEIYRANLPASMINDWSRSWSARWGFVSDIVALYNIYGAEAMARWVDAHDIFVFPRFVVPDSDPQAKIAIGRLFELIRSFGKRIVYEVDDDLTNEHRVVIEGNALEVASWADAITVTNHYLGVMMQEKTGVPYYVLPNSVDPSLWDNPDIGPMIPKSPEKVVIGLTGSRTHYDDWKQVEWALRSVADRYDDIEIWIGNCHPDYLEGIPNAYYIPGMPYPNYSQMIRGCDIILAPLDSSDKFNLSKSPIKAIEGMCARRDIDNCVGGAVVIASDHPVYEHCAPAMFAKTEFDWEAHLTFLLDNPHERKLRQVNGYKWAWKKFDASKNWKQWTQAYSKILKRSPNTTPLPT